MLKGAAKIQEQRRMEALASLTEESRGLIKKALTRLVSLKPEAIDEALIEEAAGEIKNQRI